MIKYIKWDIRNILEKWKVLFILLLIAILTAILLPTNLGWFSRHGALAISIYAIIFISILAFWSVFRMIWDLRKPTNSLEFTVPLSVSQILISKLIVNTLLFAFTYGVLFLLSLLVNRFATESTVYLTFENTPTEILQNLLEFLYVSMLIFTCYNLACSFHFSRKQVIAWTIIFILLLGILLSIISLLPLVFSGAEFTLCLFRLEVDETYVNANMKYMFSCLFNSLFFLSFTYISIHLLNKRTDISL